MPGRLPFAILMLALSVWVTAPATARRSAAAHAGAAARRAEHRAGRRRQRTAHAGHRDGRPPGARAGVATPAQASRIFAEADRRHDRYGFSSFGGALLPAYSQGFFRHAALHFEYAYQNGGQWDWHAGPFLVAEFARGRSAEADRKLTGIAERVARVDGLYEWTTRLSGSGVGSRDYAGSAASLAAALVDGSFGLALRGDRLDVRARACATTAAIDLHQPVTTMRVGYRCDTTADRTVLEVTTEGVRGGQLCVLAPAVAVGATATDDGQPAKVTIDRVGREINACLDTTVGRAPD